jgi:NADPH2:quinone reductase
MLVHGASGGVGTAVVQIARAAGLTVIGTAGSERGMQLVKAEGAHHALNHSSEGYLEELMKLTDGRGVDLILEMLANKNLGKDLTVLAKRGRLVVIGSRGPIEINPRDIMGRDADIRGTTLMNTTEHQYKQMHAALVAGLENGTLRPIIGQKIPLADASRAHMEVMKPSGAYGKIVLAP